MPKSIVVTVRSKVSGVAHTYHGPESAVITQVDGPWTYMPPSGIRYDVSPADVLAEVFSVMLNPDDWSLEVRRVDAQESA